MAAPSVPGMSVPEVVPILHEPGYRTDTIGRCRGGPDGLGFHAPWDGEYDT